MLPQLPTHPEAEAGEICIANITKDDYAHVGWTTKRMGLVAYSRYGQPIPNLFPVFVSKIEYYGTDCVYAVELDDSRGRSRIIIGERRVQDQYRVNISKDLCEAHGIEVGDWVEVTIKKVAVARA